MLRKCNHTNKLRAASYRLSHTHYHAARPSHLPRQREALPWPVVHQTTARQHILADQCVDSLAPKIELHRQHRRQDQRGARLGRNQNDRHVDQDYAVRFAGR